MLEVTKKHPLEDISSVDVFFDYYLSPSNSALALARRPDIS